MAIASSSLPSSLSSPAGNPRIAARITRVIQRLVDPGRSDRLCDLASGVGVSAFTLQRSFRRWTGLTPKQFASFVHVSTAKGLLQASSSVLDAALEVGLSGPSRLHDQFLSIEAMTPGEYKQGGAGVAIRYGRGATPLGAAMLACTARGICRLSFADGVGSLASEAAVLRTLWPAAELIRDDDAARRQLASIFRARSCASPTPPSLTLLVRGSAFQVAVWRALLEIPTGRVVSYGTLAQWVGYPRAARAVGTAVGENPIAYLIPCHRVIRATGLLGGYRWGSERKAAILAKEAIRAGAWASPP